MIGRAVAYSTAVAAIAYLLLKLHPVLASLPSYLDLSSTDLVQIATNLTIVASTILAAVLGPAAVVLKRSSAAVAFVFLLSLSLGLSGGGEALPIVLVSLVYLDATFRLSELRLASVSSSRLFHVKDAAVETVRFALIAAAAVLFIELGIVHFAIALLGIVVLRSVSKTLLSSIFVVRGAAAAGADVSVKAVALKLAAALLLILASSMLPDKFGLELDFLNDAMKWLNSALAEVVG